MSDELRLMRGRAAPAPKPAPTADDLIALLLRYVRTLHLEYLGPLADAPFRCVSLVADRYMTADGSTPTEALRRLASQVAQLAADKRR